MNIPLSDYRSLLSEHLRPQRARAIALGFFLFADIGLQLANPQIIRRFIDATQTGADLSALTRIAGLFIVLAVAQQAGGVFATWLSENVAWTATNRLRGSLARHCLDLDMSFHSAHTPGEMIERIDGDVSALGNFFSRFIFQIGGSVLLIAGILVALSMEDWRVGAGLFGFALVSLLILNSLRNIAVPHWAASRQASADLFGFLEERLAGAEDIRASNGKPYVLRRFYEYTRAWYRREVKAAMMINIVFNTSLLLFAMAVAVAMALGAFVYREGVATIGTVYLIFHYTQMLTRPIERISNQLEDLQRAGASVGRVRGLLDQTSRIAGGDRPIPPGRIAVSFDGVHFAYEKDEPVLEGISFDLQPGRLLGLLGRTGSGKTTVSRLIARLYDVDGGSVSLNGLDVREIRAGDLRRRIAIVTQNVQLFQATVRENLTLFDPAISDDRIRAVLSDLGLEPWLARLPNGLDAPLSAGGEGLSAGESQLVAFARVLLTKDPDLVILDEASSRLDPATEHLVEQSVARLLEGRTALIIAHRLGTVQRADEILILDGGRVLEHGPRAALARDPHSRFSVLLKTGLEEVLA